MPNISEMLQKIATAIYGKDMRNSIHDSIEAVNDAVDNVTSDVSDHKAAAVLDHPDGSVTTAKIANSSITTEKIANDAVTKNKIEDKSVSTEKLAFGAVTDERLADSAVNVTKRGINVYDADISKVGSGNNILYITIDGITDYAQLTGKTIAVDTKAYQCTWETPQAIYLNVNGLGTKNIYKSLPCNFADYDSDQYKTNLFTQYEIGRSNVLLLTYDSSSFILSNPPVPPKATKAITASTTDDGSYVTPKKVADFVNTKADKVTNGGFIAGSNASNGIGGVAIGDGAATDTGVAIGKSAASTDGGIAIGKDAVSQGSGGAVGYNAHETEGGGAVGRDSSTNMGGAIGYGAVSTGGGAVGNSARSTTGGAVGESASTNAGGAVGNGSSSESGGAVGENAITDTGGAIGKDAVSGNGFSGGKSAKVAANADDTYIDAIQLGTGTNDTPKTMQVYNKRIVEADGSLTDVGDLTKLSTSVKTNIVNAINSVINIEFFNPNAHGIIFNNITKIGDKRYKADVTLSGAYLKYKLWDTTYEGMNRTYKNFSFSVDNAERCGLWLDIDMLGQRNETCQLFDWELGGSDSPSITIGYLDNGQYLQFHLCDFEIIDGDTDNPIDEIYNGYDHSVIGIFEIIGGYLDSKAAKSDISEHKTAAVLDHPDKSVTTSKLADKSVTTAKIADKAVTGAKIETKTITNWNLSDNAVQTYAIENGAVTAAKLADSAVTTDKLADGAVTAEKLGDDVLQKLNGSGASSDTSTAVLNDGITYSEEFSINMQQGFWAVGLNIPSITISDTFFGPFTLPAVAAVDFSDYETGGRCYLKYTFANGNPSGALTSSNVTCTGVLKDPKGKPNSYLEIEDGCVVAALYIYVGSVSIGTSVNNNDETEYDGSFTLSDMISEQPNIPLLRACYRTTGITPTVDANGNLTL